MSTFLEKHKRQPKIFIDLPSQGKFYNSDVVSKTEGLAVFGMTAMDEIMLKTPDALFSGEATAQVMKSCIPDIIDPWKLVGYDIDYILLSIRIATYGEKIDITTKCPHCDTTNEGVVNLQQLLEHVNTYEVEKSFKLGNLEFIIQPITYRETTDYSIQSFTLEKQISQADRLSLDSKDRDKMLNDLYQEAAQLSLRVAVSYIAEVIEGEEKEADRETILAWITDNDLEFFDKVKSTLGELTEKWKLPNFEYTCQNEECGKIFPTNLDMDYSNFFGTRSLHSRSLIS